MGNYGFRSFPSLPVSSYKPQYSLKFDGSTGWISSNDYMGGTKWALPGKNLSVSLWFKAFASASCSVPFLISKNSYYGVNTDDFPISIGLNQAATQLSFSLDSGNDWSYDAYLTSVVVPGVWYHACCIYDGALALLYINGALMSSMAYSASLSYSSTPRHWALGRTSYENSGGVNQSYLTGNLTDVRIFADAKTESEVAALYRGAIDTPLLWWKCDDGTGTVLTESMGGRHGTLNGGVTWSGDTP